MKHGKIILQGNWYSLYYDGQLHTYQFNANVPKAEILKCLADLMPDYLFVSSEYQLANLNG
jgi:hypothetical protein